MKLKLNSAITMVALVITIVILLILASVTLTMVLGDNGLLNKAKASVDKYQEKAMEEELMLAQIESTIDDTNSGDSKLNSIFLNCYPVGSIYMSGNDTNPEKIWGGKWERYAQGQVLVGVNEEDVNFDTAGKTGGEKRHTLSVAEMPSHNHAFEYNSGGGGTGFWSISVGEGIRSTTYTIPTGGNQPHNNLQPYITCYMWIRTE